MRAIYNQCTNSTKSMMWSHSLLYSSTTCFTQYRVLKPHIVSSADLGIAKSNPGFSLDSDAELEIDFFTSSSLEGPEEEQGEWRVETDTFGDDISVDSDEYDNTEYSVDLDITLDSTVYDEYDGQEALGGSVSDYSAGELSVEYSDSGADFGVDLTVDVDAAADAFGISSGVAEVRKVGKV